MHGTYSSLHARFAIREIAAMYVGGRNDDFGEVFWRVGAHAKCSLLADTGVSGAEVGRNYYQSIPHRYLISFLQIALGKENVGLTGFELKKPRLAP